MTLDEIIDLAGHRDVPAWVLKLVKEAIEIERDACAQVCEQKGMVKGGEVFAARIRARGK